MMIKKLVSGMFAALGIGVYRLKPKKGIEDKHKKQNANLKWLGSYHIKSVFDIGANEGQFALEIRNTYPEIEIYSFEPLADCFKTLKAAFNGDKHFHAYNCALGEVSESRTINRNEYNASSSLLHVSGEHKLNFPTASREFPEEIVVKTFDEVMDISTIRSPYLVKIDVQGYEKHVIKGSSDLIRNAACLIVEVSFRELYKDQPLFPEIYELLKDFGFEYHGAFDVLRSPIDAQILQEDAIFINQKPTDETQ